MSSPTSLDSSEPSGPVVGPEMRLTVTPGFSRRPRTVAMVFSCAPPTTSLVMMWVTRMASLGFIRFLHGLVRCHTFEFCETVGDVFGLSGLGRRVGEVGFVIADRSVGVFAAISDLAETVADLRSFGGLALDEFVVLLSFIEFVRAEVGDSAIQHGADVGLAGGVRLNGQHLREGFDGFIESGDFDEEATFVDEAGGFFGREFQHEFIDGERIGVASVVRVGFTDAAEDGEVVGEIDEVGFEDLGGGGWIVLGEVGGGFEREQIGQVGAHAGRASGDVADLADQFQSAIRELAVEIDLAKPKAAADVVGGLGADTIKRLRRLTDQAALKECVTLSVAETGIIVGTVEGEHGVP